MFEKTSFICSGGWVMQMVEFSTKVCFSNEIVCPAFACLKAFIQR